MGRGLDSTDVDAAKAHVFHLKKSNYQLAPPATVGHNVGVLTLRMESSHLAPRTFHVNVSDFFLNIWIISRPHLSKLI